MASTLTERVLARAAGRPVKPGDEVWATSDLTIMNDSSGPRRLATLVAELGGLRDPARVVVVSDHFVPAANLRHAAILKQTRRWATAERIGAFYEYDGILHNLILERELVNAGMLVVGADSHTTTAGAVGAVALAVGSTELATVLATRQVWVTVPETVRIELSGRLPAWCDARDVTMRILGDHGTRAALGRAIEYGGSWVVGLDLEARLVLANQGTEMGAVNAVIDRDDLGVGGTWAVVHRYDVSALVPCVAMPSSPASVTPAAAVADRIDMAWIGSCVGGRGADLRAAARVLAGGRVAVPTLVTPATRQIHDRALADGTLATLTAAGCTILPPACGACAGVHAGVQGDGDRVIATATRNFPGRMGSRDAAVYLGSAFTVAASALRGQITDPRAIEVTS
jgi:3-isopropylmalate/(R)-2-methylmalate dehydratase large subunit